MTLDEEKAATIAVRADGADDGDATCNDKRGNNGDEDEDADEAEPGTCAATATATSDDAAIVATCNDKRGNNGDEDEDADEAEPGTCADTATATSDDAAIAKAASWMSGKWGIGWRHRPGDIRGENRKFRVDKLVKEIQSIPGVGYVLFGLSGGAIGSGYIAPHSVLSKINPESCPKRDLFGDLATAFQAAGYKVLAYMATEGPAQLHHGNKSKQGKQYIENWKSFVLDKYGSNDTATLKRAYAEVIVGEYAERYGTKIDGWWFDHASFGNIRLLRDICKKANPDTVLAFSNGKLGMIRNSSPDYEDYTFGHPIPIRRCKASDKRNLRMVKDIEKSSDGFIYAKGKPSLGHMFMPMHARWNGGKDVVWTEDQAVDWMGRVLNAGGAWTWNVPISFQGSDLHGKSSKFARRVGTRLLEQNTVGEEEL